MPDANLTEPDLPQNRIWRVGSVEFDQSRRELRVSGLLRTVEAKPLLLLETLLSRAGDVVTKEELLATVWKDRTVVEQSLTTAVGKLRDALGDEGRAMIEAVRGVGYRIGPPIEMRAAPEKPRLALTFEPGDVVPNRSQWRLERSLGGSAARDVWLARHSKTGEQRVFKFADTTERLNALRREAALSRILHNALGHRADLVRISEWSFNTRPFFIESAFGGDGLPGWAESQGGLTRLPLAERIAIVARIARTVGAAHDVGVLHRDIKPTNVLISGNGHDLSIRLVDFGSGRLTETARLSAVTVTGLGLTSAATHDGERLSGTLRYMAPEVLRGGPPTIAADVYALGVLLYQMVVGDLDRSLALGWEAEVDDEILRIDVACSASGQPLLRLSSASTLADRLESIETRRSELRQQAIRAAEHQQMLRDAEQRRLEAAASAREIALAYKHANRMRLVALSLAALFAISAFLAIFGYHEQQIANAQRDRAEQITAVTTSAVSSLVNDMTTSLRDKAGVPLSVLQQVIGEAEVILARMSRLTPDDRELQRLHARALSEFADTYLHQGNLQQALEAGEHAVHLQRALLTDTPNSPDLKEDLSRSERWVGDIKLKRREFQPAMRAYIVALQMMTELVRLDPGNAEYQQRLARCEEAIGTVQLAQQSPGAALTTFRIARQIIQRGSPSTLAKADWQLDLSVTNQRVGDALDAVGDFRGALAAYQTMLEIERRLVSIDRDNIRWLRDLSVAESEVGDEQRALNSKQDALASYKAGLLIGKKLVSMDPANVLLQRDLALGEDEVGNAEADVGDLQAAKEILQQANNDLQPVLLQSPTDESFQHDSAAMEADFAKVLLKYGDFPQAEKHWEKASSTIRRLASKHPSDKELASDSKELDELGRNIRAREVGPLQPSPAPILAGH